MTLTRQQLREKLPGYEGRDVICCEKRANGHNKSLALVYRITGFCNDVFFVHNFWVETFDGIGNECKTFNHFQEAMDYYATLV